MHSTKKESIVKGVKGFCRRFSGSVHEIWKGLIPQERLIKELGEEDRKWRERIYSPLQTLKLFIEQVLQEDHGCQSIVAQSLSERLASGQPPCSTDTGAYCKARARLPLSLPVYLTQEIGKQICSRQPENWRWREREIKLVDGTTVSMPDTKANQEVFPQNKEQ